MIRVIIAGVFILSGLVVLCIGTLGMFIFSHMLNRLHISAKCGTMGSLLILSGLIVISGWNMFSLKLVLLMLFMSICSPVAYYLAARAEVKTNSELENICDFVDLADLSEGVKNDADN